MMTRQRPWVLVASTLFLLAAACDDKKPTGATPVTGSAAGSSSATSATVSDGPVDLTVLITADENGHLVADGDPAKGGAAAMAGKWAADEKFCVGQDAKCDASPTLALSAGDHFSGPAISSYYQGESTAEVMKAMGYKASSFGNHDFDYGDEGFSKFVTTSGIKHVGANFTAKAGSALEKAIQPYTFVTRGGVKVGVIGVASVDTAKKTMADRLAGSTIGPIEDALSNTVPKVWKEGADAIVVLSHDCPDVLKPVFEKHDDWHVSVVAGAHCKKLDQVKAGGAVLASPGRDFKSYLRAKLKVDKKKDSGMRVTDVNVERVELTEKAPADATVAAVVDKWKKQLDAKLSEEIGFTAKGLERHSAEETHVFLGAIRKQLGTDVALVNKGGFRGGVPAGKVTKASIYSAIPYENSVMVATLTGEALSKALAKENAVFDGATGSGKDFKVNGAAIDPKKTYKVATLDFLYFGGDGFDFEKDDPNAQESGMVWQTPVIEGIAKEKSSDKKPLETIFK